MTAAAGLRLSVALRSRLERAGEISATTRALLILGLAASGEDIGPYQDEARRALAGVFDPGIAQALGRLLYAGSTGVEPMFNTRSTPVEPLAAVTPAAPPAIDLADDPFAGIGIDV